MYTGVVVVITDSAVTVVTTDSAVTVVTIDSAVTVMCTLVCRHSTVGCHCCRTDVHIGFSALSLPLLTIAVLAFSVTVLCTSVSNCYGIPPVATAIHFRDHGATLKVLEEGGGGLTSDSMCVCVCRGELKTLFLSNIIFK